MSFFVAPPERIYYEFGLRTFKNKTMTPLADKELTILLNIFRDSSVTQRELAKITGMSLGLINVFIQRFIGRGHITVSHPNKRRLQYSLTPLGLAETFNRAHRHATNTIRDYKKIRTSLEKLIKDLRSRGYEYFSIHGDSELKELLAETFKKLQETADSLLGEEHRDDPKAIVLKVTTNPLPVGFQGESLNVLEMIED